MERNNIDLHQEHPQKTHPLFGKLSIGIAAVLTLLLLNFFLDIVPFQKLRILQLMSLFFIAPFGVVLGMLGIRKQKDTLSLIGIISNIILWLFPSAYNIIVTLIWGP